MILNKYNEIMSNVTVDPEMKSRIMGAVSAAITEQSGSAVVTDIPKDKIRNENSGNKNQVRKAEVKPAQTRKKAKKTPIAIISSIAAGVLVIAGALFVDAGNVWTLQGADTEDNRLGRFQWNTFGDSIAANCGAGVRLDFGFLLLRMDLGLRVHDPAREYKWVGPDKWFKRDGYALHFGVGYPF